MRRDLEQAKQLELGLVKVRWLLIAYGVVQTFVERVDPNAPSFAFTLGLVLTTGLLLSNLFFTQFVRQARKLSDVRWVGAVAFILDTVVILEWVWVAAHKPSDPAWVMTYLLPIEGAIRFGILGAFAPLPIVLVSEITREMYLSNEYPGYHFVGPAVAFRVGMAAIIALVAGMFANSLRRESERAIERTIMAEDAAQRAEDAARREAEARRDLHAFHTAILAGVASEDPAQGIQEIAEAVGREMECDSLGVLLLEPGEGGSEVLVAAGVYGDPGYRRGTRFVPGASRSLRERSWHGRACGKTPRRRSYRFGPATSSSGSSTSDRSGPARSIASACCSSGASPTRSRWSCRRRVSAPARRRCSSVCGSWTS